LLVPGTAFAFAERIAQPVLLLPPLPKDATPWALLSWGLTPLHGMSRILRFRAASIMIQTSKATLLGFLAPSAHMRSQSPRLNQRRRLPGFAGGAPQIFSAPMTSMRHSQSGNPLAVPNPPVTEPLSGFLNLSAAFILSLPSHHFRVGGALGVMPFRGLRLTRNFDNSSLPTYPHDVLPSGCATSFLGRGSTRHQAAPRMIQLAYFRLQGFHPRVKQLRQWARFSVPSVSLPLLGFHLLMA
jgi:hypothetical protein